MPWFLTAVDQWRRQNGDKLTRARAICSWHGWRCLTEERKVEFGERIRSGMARAKDKGTKSGKPIGRPPVPLEIQANLRADNVQHE